MHPVANRKEETPTGSNPVVSAGEMVMTFQLKVLIVSAILLFVSFLCLIVFETLTLREWILVGVTGFSGTVLYTLAIRNTWKVGREADCASLEN